MNYSDEWNTWEPLENLIGSQDLVEEFEKKEAEKERKREEARAALEAKKKANREKKEAEREAREAKRREQTALKKKEKSKSVVDTSSSEDEDKAETIKREYEEKPNVTEDVKLKDDQKVNVNQIAKSPSSSSLSQPDEIRDAKLKNERPSKEVKRDLKGRILILYLFQFSAREDYLSRVSFPANHQSYFRKWAPLIR